MRPPSAPPAGLAGLATGMPAANAAGLSAAASADEPDGIRLDVVDALLQRGEVDRQIVVLHDMPGSRLPGPITGSVRQGS